jgi:hypothetical protein
MTVCKDICCKEFIDEIQCEKGSSVLLYTVDGFVYLAGSRKFSTRPSRC